MNETITLELNDKNCCNLVRLAKALYSQRVEELNLPVVMNDYFAKYIKKENPKCVFNAIMSNDDSWLRDVVTYGIINDLMGGISNVLDTKSEQFWGVVYDFFGMDADNDTFIEYDILNRFNDDVNTLEKELTTPCNQLVTYIFEVYCDPMTK